MNFEGTYVAMVTPFDEKGCIDEEGFRSNINYLIENGVSGLVGAGTTGESATITHDEHQKIIEILVDEVDGRVETIAGTGSNSTQEAIDLTKYAKDAGADAALVITPYYNKPQQHALVEHYRALSGCDIPIIAYNVPSRTGVMLKLLWKLQKLIILMLLKKQAEVLIKYLIFTKHFVMKILKMISTYCLVKIH